MQVNWGTCELSKQDYTWPIDHTYKLIANQRVCIIITMAGKEESRLCGCIPQVCYCLFCRPKMYIKQNLAYVPDRTGNRKNILRARATKGQQLLKDGFSIE